MSKYIFRDHTPKRTCNKHYMNYQDYKPYLASDFEHRCAYCNLRDYAITSFFEVDHFVPQAVFKDVCPDLIRTYANLVYACKRCNGAKSNHYDGDISKKEIVNNLFYDPVETNYNAVFYRNESGEICSDDEKGNNMITLLRLYCPIHSAAWICEQLEKTNALLKSKMESMNPASEQYIKMKEARYELLEFSEYYHALFIANYNNKDW